MSETALKHKAEAPASLNFAIIICSSSRYRELKLRKHVDDLSGNLITQALQKCGHGVALRAIIPDDESRIEQSVKRALKSRKVDAIITCGGTGISPTDVTIETIQPLLEKELHGFGEIFRRLSYDQIGSAAILTRAIAGVSMGKAIFCIPGSPQAVSLVVEKLILPEVGHIIKHARER
ncbi:MAG: Molybdopterin adenylyltransferase [Candidatus Bathyarchaeota archaeon BA1]|nr:MAG: Molybdopterin adenylyltransferase [Candidatus Bathyarchaeota archaeon BA1]